MHLDRTILKLNIATTASFLIWFETLRMDLGVEVEFFARTWRLYAVAIWCDFVFVKYASKDSVLAAIPFVVEYVKGDWHLCIYFKHSSGFPYYLKHSSGFHVLLYSLPKNADAFSRIYYSPRWEALHTGGTDHELPGDLHHNNLQLGFCRITGGLLCHLLVSHPELAGRMIKDMKSQVEKAYTWNKTHKKIRNYTYYTH